MELGILVQEQGLGKTMAICHQYIEMLNPDCIWVPDRLLYHDFSGVREFMGLQGKAAPAEPADPFVTIAALAASTSAETTFGIAVTDLIRRKSPDLARACDSVSHLLKRPFNIGFGAGESINLVPLGYGAHDKPVSLMDNELQRFAGIMERGVYLSDAGKEVVLGYNSRPSRIWIGGQRDRMLRITARNADGWLPAWKMGVEEYAMKVATLKNLARDYGRPPVMMGMFGVVMVGTSRDELFAAINANPLLKADALLASGELWDKYGLRHPAGNDTKGLPNALLEEVEPSVLYEALCAVPNELLDEVMFIGSPEDILSQLQPYREVGMEHMAFWFPDPATMKSVYGVDDFDARMKFVCDELRRW